MAEISFREGAVVSRVPPSTDGDRMGWDEMGMRQKGVHVASLQPSATFAPFCVRACVRACLCLRHATQHSFLLLSDLRGPSSTLLYSK